MEDLIHGEPTLLPSLHHSQPSSSLQNLKSECSATGKCACAWACASMNVWVCRRVCMCLCVRMSLDSEVIRASGMVMQCQTQAGEDMLHPSKCTAWVQSSDECPTQRYKAVSVPVRELSWTVSAVKCLLFKHLHSVSLIVFFFQRPSPFQE